MRAFLAIPGEFGVGFTEAQEYSSSFLTLLFAEMRIRNEERREREAA